MNNTPADLPVILLYNLDRCLASCRCTGDPEPGTKPGNRVYRTVGHPTQTICLEDDRSRRVMAGCDPARQIVFNWCEEVPGIPRSSSLVARKLEELGFTFTGADSQRSSFSQDKPAVKERLLQKGISTPCWQVYTGGGIPGLGLFSRHRQACL